jgi:2-aminoadipate transaminase
MKPSALRELLKVMARPGMISFAGGLPAAELFPLERVEGAVQEVLRRLGGTVLQYGETEGVPELREWIARRHSSAAFDLTQDNVLITTGAQQALDLVGRVFLNEGDQVIVENPTYLAALQAWRSCGATFLPVDTDHDGMRMEGVLLLDQPPKMAYLIPNFQNPTGACLTRERRRLLIDIAQDRDLPRWKMIRMGNCDMKASRCRASWNWIIPPMTGGASFGREPFPKRSCPVCALAGSLRRRR